MTKRGARQCISGCRCWALCGDARLAHVPLCALRASRQARWADMAHDAAGEIWTSAPELPPRGPSRGKPNCRVASASRHVVALPSLLPSSVGRACITSSVGRASAFRGGYRRKPQSSLRGTAGRLPHQSSMQMDHPKPVQQKCLSTTRPAPARASAATSPPTPPTPRGACGRSGPRRRRIFCRTQRSMCMALRQSHFGSRCPGRIRF